MPTTTRRRLLISFLVAVAIVCALAAGAKLVVPRWVAGKIEQGAREATGRKLTIGTFDLSLSRTLTVTAGDLRFANLPSGSQPDMVRLDRVRIEVDLLSIVSHPIRVRRVELDGMRVLLEKTGDGRANWVIDLPERPPRDTPKPPGPAIEVDDAALHGFSFVLTPGGKARPLEVDVEALSAHHDVTTDLIELRGNGAFNDQPWHIGGTIGPLAKIYQGHDIDQALNGAIGEATLSLTGHLRDPMTLGGPSLRVDVTGPDVVDTLAVFGLRSPLAGPFHLDARLAPHGDDVGIDLAASIESIDAKASGTLSSLLDPRRIDMTIDATGPDAAEVGRWTGVAGLPSRPYRVAGKMLWADRRLAFDDLDVRVGTISARVNGSLGEFPRCVGTDLGIVARGDDLSDLSSLTRLALPKGRFDVRGRFLRRADALAIDDTLLTIGETTIHATGTIGEPPALANLDLTTEGSGPDASILSEIAHFELPPEPFDLRGRVARAGPELRLEKVDGHLGGVAFAADGALVPRGALVGTHASVRVGGEDLARFVALFGARGVPSQPFDIAGHIAISDAGYDLDSVVARVGVMDVSADGRLGRKLTDGTSLTAHVSGNHLSELAAWGVSPKLPADAFTASGRLRIDGGVYFVDKGHAEIGDDRLDVDGTLGALPDLSTYDLDAKASGPSVSALARFFDTSASRWPEQPFEARGRVHHAPGGVGLGGARATIGTTIVAVDGTVGATTDATVHVESPDTTLAASLLGWQLPEGAVRLDGRIAREASGYRFEHVKLALGPAYGEISGTLGEPPAFERSAFDVALEGPDLASVLGPVTGIAPLPTDGFAISGHVEGDRHAIGSDRLRVRLGDSDVEGVVALGLDAKPFLETNLRAKRIDVTRLIAGFAAKPDEVADASPSKTGLLIPETPLSLEPLRGLDATIRLEAGEVALPGVPLRDVAIDGALRDGGIRIDRFEGTGENGGRTTGDLSLEPAEGGYRFAVTARLAGGRLTIFGNRQAAKSAPGLDLELEVAGSGRSLHEIAAGSNGRLLVTLGPGHVPNSLTDALSSPILRSLFDALNPLRKTSPDTPMECAVAAAAIDGGKVVVEPIAARSDKLTVLGHGSLDLGTEAIDLVWTLKPRQGVGISPGTIVNPFIKLGGTLASPRLDAKPLEAAATTGAAVVTAGITVLLKGFYDRITAEKNVCARALTKARKQEEKRAARDQAAAP